MLGGDLEGFAARTMSVDKYIGFVFFVEPKEGAGLALGRACGAGFPGAHAGERESGDEAETGRGRAVGGGSRMCKVCGPRGFGGRSFV